MIQVNNSAQYRTVITVNPVLPSSSSSGNLHARGKPASSHLDTLIVGVCLLVFLVCIWLWSAHTFYINHLGDAATATATPGSLLEEISDLEFEG